MPNAIAIGGTCRSPQGFWWEVTEGDQLVQVCEAATRKTRGPSQNLWRAAPRQLAAAGGSGQPAPRPATAAVWFRWPRGRHGSCHH